ncbi:MAG: four helix bundle protein [Bacteroidales bacterium]|nr:four helix bundle protein [Bacteroidales bacterium]
MTHDNIVADKSVDFAIRITNCYKYLVREKREDIMSKQLFRSGTSIGANIHEGIQGQSRADFVSKLNIALKEASETSYWLVVLHKANFLEEKLFNSLKEDLDEIMRLLIASIKTAKKNMA